MSLTPRQKMAVAMMRVCEPPNGMAPYFGVMLRGLVRREMDEAMIAAHEAMGQKPTLGVTANGVLYWAPAFVESIEVEQLALVLVHETMHVVLKHAERGATLGIPMDYARNSEQLTNSQIWNIACDASINDEIRKMGKLPGHCVFPETLGQEANLPAEERYHLLKQEQKKCPAPPKGPGGGSCGGCARNPLPGEAQDPGANGPAEGRSEAEMERFRKQVAEDVQTTAKGGRGTVPASLVRWADEMLAPPKIPWQEKLQRLVRSAVAHRAGAVDYTWTRTSRRQGGVGYGVGRAVMPALHAPIPDVAIVLDTSGSMGTDELNAAMSEVQGVLNAAGARVTFVVCDAMVHGVKQVRSAQDAISMLKGGGGTAMAPALEAVSELQPEPGVCIVMTDGYIDDPPEPRFTVIWAIVGGNKEFTRDYGEVVIIDDVKEAA